MTEFRPDVGDLVWIDLDPRTGREQGGRRPALVVSPRRFTDLTGFAVICPITSRVRPFPTSVVLPPGLSIEGEILVSAVRSIDVLARPIQSAGVSVPAGIAQEVRERLALIITI